MNTRVFNAQFSISTEEAIRLKFENELDDIVKHNLAKKLVEEIIKNDLLNIHSVKSIHNNYETLFNASLLVCKQDLCAN